MPAIRYTGRTVTVAPCYPQCLYTDNPRWYVEIADQWTPIGQEGNPAAEHTYDIQQQTFPTRTDAIAWADTVPGVKTWNVSK